MSRYGTLAGASAAKRSSRLHRDGRFLVHGDFHNHTLLSDGAGRADEAFGQMRAAGLDVAALTDHAVMGKLTGNVCASGQCTAYMGINDASWQTLGDLADKADAPGRFTAIRGFEWTTGQLGHVNVWFSEQWTDPASTNGLVDPAAASGLAQIAPPLAPLFEPVQPGLDAVPSTASLEGLYEWLRSSADRPLFGGGPEAVAGFNHPGQYGDFDSFRFNPAVVDKLVSVEAFSFGKGDYLYENVDQGDPSPIGRCLDAGWRTGMLGVSDEHGEVYGRRDQARTGLWVQSLTRAGVREALLARRFFATRVPGVRLDASANQVRMGSVLGHRRGPVRITWDLAGGTDWTGRRLVAQVLTTGSPLPGVVASVPFRVPGPSEPLPSLTVSHDVEDGRWLLLRITDPAVRADKRASGPYVAAGDAIAYASPFFLDPDRRRS